MSFFIKHLGHFFKVTFLKEVQLLLNIKLGYSLPFLFTCFLTCETVAKTEGIQLVT